MITPHAAINLTDSSPEEKLMRLSWLCPCPTSADLVNTLEFHMRLLSAEQLWAQIGFFHYGQKGQVKF